MSVPIIRPASEADLSRLVVVELEAGRAFRDIGLAEVAGHVPHVDDLRTAVAVERVWVTEVGGEVAGYVVGEVVDGNAHVEQVSVSPQHAGRRLGRAMTEHVEDWGRAHGCRATTLTTFRDVPWNAPYYLRLGYRILPGDHIGPELARLMAHEAALPGIDASSRCAMVKDHGPGHG